MFHWICPECGREIPPSMRECQVCDPQAAVPSVVEPIQIAPVVHAAPVAHEVVPVDIAPVAKAADVIELKPEPIAAPRELLLLVAPGEPVLEPFIEVAPVLAAKLSVELAQEPVALVAAAEIVPVLESKPPVEVAPEPVVEVVAEAAVPVVEANPQVEVAPEPLVEVAADVTVPVVEAKPPVEVAPEPVVEVVAEAAVPIVEAKPPAEAPPEPVAHIATIAEVVPAVEPTPELAVVPVAAQAPLPEPVPVLASPVEPPPAKVHELDPLLALAEEIRAVQAARAAALVAPPVPEPAYAHEASDLIGLSEALSAQEPTPEPKAEPVAQQAKPVVQEPVAQEPVAQIDTPVLVEKAPALAGATSSPLKFANAVALLAAPEPTIVESQPVALVPDPSPVALAPEPTPEPEGPMLPLAPMQPYTAATSRSIQPVPPRAQILAADSGPRITLPGPTLPPELTRLQDANVVTVIGEKTETRAKEALLPQKSAGAPGWLVSIAVMAVLLAVGLTVVFYFLPHTAADAKPVVTPAEAATVPAPVVSTSPLGKLIEVTGFRIVVDGNKKSEVQYLIVNHSAADISGANVFVTLRSAKPGQAPVCRFSFKVPSMGAFESKEMSSPIEKATRAVSLPDWQDLRADVQISQ